MNRSKDKKPPYLDRADELAKVTIVRLKGNIDQSMVPVIEARIQSNRKKGSKIDKNIIIDYAKVKKIDTAAIAFHFVKLKEYEAKGFKVGFINPSKQLCDLIHMFQKSNTFKVFSSEKIAIDALNQ